MERCDVCGNAYENTFRVTFSDGHVGGVFDCMECAIERIAPRCTHCECRIIGKGLAVEAMLFCSEHCAREASSAAVDEASRESFPASDPPAHAPATIAAPTRIAQQIQDEAGKVGWAVLWLLGIPIPVLLVLFVLRGCT